MNRLCLLVILCATAGAQKLAVTYSDRGIQTLAYNNLKLVDLTAYPGDVFAIRHTKVTDLNGAVQDQYGWGDKYVSRAFDTASRTWKTVYDWGSITVRFTQQGDTLDMAVTETNRPDSGYILQGAAIYLANFHFPQLPLKWGSVDYPQVAYSTFGPSIVTADWGSGEVTIVDPSVTDTLYTGFLNDNSRKPNYYPVLSTVPPDGLPSFAPQYSFPVRPGQNRRFRMSLRFAPTGTSHSTVASDVYSAWRRTYPQLIGVKNWDRRPIGTVFFGSSPHPGKDVSKPGGCGPRSGNPRNYFNDCSVNINTPNGLQAFQTRVLNFAEKIVSIALKYSWQGAITWDVEGEEWPQTTSYVCSPDQIAQIAPEMVSVVKGQTGSLASYNGQPLAEAFFAIQTSHGLKAGVCTRPQQLQLGPNDTATQVFLPDDKAASVLDAKMKFANKSWGVTMFYADTFVHADGGNIDPSVIRPLMQANSHFLLMPEINSQNYSVLASFQYSAPFYNFEYHTDLGTPADVPDVYKLYPWNKEEGRVVGPFGVNLVNEVNAGVLRQHQSQLTQAASRGDILMGHVDHDEANNALIEQIYTAAQPKDSSLCEPCGRAAARSR